MAKLVKNKIENRQREYWEELSIDIEKAVKDQDPAAAFDLIRRLRGGRSNMEHIATHNKDGNTLTNSKDRLKRWRKYFDEMLNVNTVVDEQTLQQIPTPCIEEDELLRQDAVPTIGEVTKGIQQMKSGTAPGKDEAAGELLKASGLLLAEWVHEIIRDIWEQEVMVKDWTVAVLIRLYKNKDDKRICDKYRRISLLVVTGKVFARVLLNRIQTCLIKKLLEQQAGFRSGRSTIDQIFTLKTTMKKSTKFNQPLHMCFIDLQKAYDSVNRKAVWRICHAYGLSNKNG